MPTWPILCKCQPQERQGRERTWCSECAEWCYGEPDGPLCLRCAEPFHEWQIAEARFKAEMLRAAEYGWTDEPAHLSYPPWLVFPWEQQGDR